MHLRHTRRKMRDYASNAIPEEKLQQHFTSTTEKSVKVPDELAKTVAAIIVPTELLNRFVDIDEHDMERLTSVTPREGKKGKK